MMLTMLILASGLHAVPARAQEFSHEEIEAARQDPAAYTLDPGSIRIERVDALQAPRVPEPGPAPAPPAPPTVDPGTIINIGKIIWEIIEANRPVVDVKQSYATAVPDGITHWTQLGGWRAPEATAYEFSAKNLKGEKAVSVRFLALRTVGGQYQGKGRYLTAVGADPTLISVSSGYKFYLEASVPKESIANVGTSENPLAGMVLTLKWKITTTFNVTQGARLFYLRGDGLFQELEGSAKPRNARPLMKALEGGAPW